MESLLAIQRLSELQAKFSECSFPFDSEALLAMAQHEMEPPLIISNSNSSSDSSVSGSNASDSANEIGIPIPSGELLNAKIVDYRGQKVAGFELDGKMMICLPQVYELFLKNMVGGLHTVYTKLRRLDVTPLICNVEQVRTLRSVGAIQPGVNRCKLIEISDFEKLLEDCTNTCTRPGRPPKRYSTEEWMALTAAKRDKYESDSQSDTNTTSILLPHTNVTMDPRSSAAAAAALLSTSTLNESQCLLSASAPPTLIPVPTSAQCQTNPLLIGNLLPPFAVQQLLMQHMMNGINGTSQKSIQSQSMSTKMPICAEATTISEEISENSSSNSSDQLNEYKDEESEENNADGSQPLNLTKNSGSEPTSDNDSIENLKELSSNQSLSMSRGSERGASSSGSNDNSPDESTTAVEKMVNLIEMARDIFKRERDEFNELRNTVKNAICGEEKLRLELEKERKKSHTYFRRYCKARREMLSLKEELLSFRSSSNSSSSANNNGSPCDNTN